MFSWLTMKKWYYKTDDFCHSHKDMDTSDYLKRIYSSISSLYKTIMNLLMKA